jgi:hypothetical protein
VSCADPQAIVIADRLRTAGTSEEKVVMTLERLVGTLTHLDNLRDFVREIGQIRSGQEQIARETEDLQLKAIVANSDIAPAERATARQLSQRQLEMARRVDKLQTRMEETHQQLTGDDQAVGDALAKALAVARGQSLGSRMREAAQRLSQHQLGEAERSEQEILEVLKRLQAIFASARDGSSADAAADGRGNEKSAQQQPGPSEKGKESGETATGKPGDGTNRAERGTKEATEAADVRDVLRRVWGHLPEKVREQMQSSVSEQFLPQYERLIEEYYKRLAEDRAVVP